MATEGPVSAAQRPLAIFRCDASLAIGGGHAVRCLALAEVLAEDGWLIGFAVSDETLDVVPSVARSDEVATGFGTSLPDVTHLEARWPSGCSLLVVDHYRLADWFESGLSRWAKRRLVIDDLADRPHACEFLVDQTICRSAEAYVGLVPSACRILTGPDYAILRRPFAERRHHIPADPPDRPLRRVTVSLGMVDAANATTRALEAIALSGVPVAADVILGPSALHGDSVRMLIDKLPGSRLHVDIESERMVDILAETDLVIGAAGTSSYERLCLGVPALVTELASNQHDNIAALEAVGAVHSLGPVEGLTAERIAGVLSELASAPDRLRPMRRAALAQCDGRGAHRIALAVRTERSRDGAEVLFRRARLDDAALIYDWQCEPKTRRLARNPTVPAWEDHVAWLERKLAHPAVLFNIVLVDGLPAGVVRLDPTDPILGARECFEVSIYLNAPSQGRGVALAALRLARRLVPRAELHAFVLRGNAASHALFRKADYRWFTDRYINAAQNGAGENAQRRADRKANG